MFLEIIMEGRHSSPKHSAASARRAVNSPAVPYERKTAAEKRDVSERVLYEARERIGNEHRIDTGERYKAENSVAEKHGRGLIWIIIRDILMTGLILVVFAFFHHVLPRFTARNTVIKPVSTVSVTAPVSASPEITPEPAVSSGITDDPVETEPVSVETDYRTEWQKKFADKFTDEVVKTENSYSSPNVSVTIDTFSGMYNGYYQTYYVADIYIADIDNFKTYFANDQFVYYGSQDAVAMAKNSGAIVSMNGDYCNNQKFGILVRNGEVYYDDPMEFDLCVLYYDGTVETYSPSEYDPADIISAGAYQTWKFGPKLLDSNGKAMTSFNTTYVVEKEEAPRSGFGYYEPGHYCFVVADGRQSHARGMVLSEFAQLFEDLGCVRAYNMDGGASSVLTFDGNKYNIPSGYRELGEILLIAETSEPIG